MNSPKLDQTTAGFEKKGIKMNDPTVEATISEESTAEECIICREVKAPHDMHIMSSCNQRICRCCFEVYTSDRLNRGLPFQCPYCRTGMSDLEILQGLKNVQTPIVQAWRKEYFEFVTRQRNAHIPDLPECENCHGHLDGIMHIPCFCVNGYCPRCDTILVEETSKWVENKSRRCASCHDACSLKVGMSACRYVACRYVCMYLK